MKYSVVTCTDGNFLVCSEHNKKEDALKAFHTLCAALINDTGFSSGMVKVLDENLDAVDGKKEFITHPAPEPEPEPEPNHGSVFISQ